MFVSVSVLEVTRLKKEGRLRVGRHTLEWVSVGGRLLIQSDSLTALHDEKGAMINVNLLTPELIVLGLQIVLLISIPFDLDPTPPSIPPSPIEIHE